MQINRSKHIAMRINQFLEQKFANDIINVAAMNLTFSHTVLNHGKSTDEITKQAMDSPELHNLFRDTSAIEFYGHIANPLAKTCPDNINITDILAVAIAISNQSRIFTSQNITGNPYYTNIQIQEQTSGPFKLEQLSYEPYEIATYDTLWYDKKRNLVLPRLCYFTDTFAYPTLTETKNNKDMVWMSITPNEITTMEPAIQNATGDILTLGLGLGYYAYMVSRKNSVKTVTVVEKENAVIDLFTKYILPQFDHPEKIKIIKADAYDYIKNLDDGKFNQCFIDTWSGVTETESYFRMKAICKRFRKMKISYWIEDAFLFMFRDWVFLRILDAASDIFETQKQTLPDITEMTYTKIYLDNICGHINIAKPDDLNNAMKPANILTAIGKVTVPKHLQ